MESNRPFILITDNVRTWHQLTRINISTRLSASTNTQAAACQGEVRNQAERS
jgi:hypothetical protein